ncbi:hypothetical protein [Microbacterium sp. NPDC057650]|uniref:hypothetical protein n=1 Tax=unclassified Microbacterium TaxID=2609290 RepID=UPI0036706713
MLYADVTTPSEAEALAIRILAIRPRPLVLVSATPEGEFAFDGERLRQELGDVADVVTIATGRATHALEELLPPKTHAFGGAARSYPVDFGQDPDWSRSRLRFPGQADTDDLIADAMAQSVQQVRRTVESAAPAAIRRATGVVKGFIADDTRALVELGDGTTVTATGDLLPDTLPLAFALVPGSPVSGILHGQELHPEPFPADLGTLTDGANTLALVVKVTELRATVHLHPDHAFVLRRRDVSTDESPVSDVLAVGDVIRVRIGHGPSGEVLLSHAARDDDALLTPAFPLVTGGAPWLSEDRKVARADAAEQTLPDAPAPALPDDYATRDDVRMLAQAITALRGDLLAVTSRVGRGGDPASGSSSAELEQLRAENARLRSELADERAERARAEARLSETAQDQRDNARALRDARRAAERAHVDPTEDGIRFEIERTWGNRTAPGERGRWPLREFRFGADFIRSLSKLDENQLSKAVRACVDAITGRDREIPARDLHRLRTGEGGDDAYVVRADGAKCWRSAIEQNTPGARRLHYWELPGDLIELSRIVTHDDTRP